MLNKDWSIVLLKITLNFTLRQFILIISLNEEISIRHREESMKRFS
jgi:hypothetical protein